MKTMFDNYQTKKIPSSIDDCLKTDNVASNLWIWCQRLEKLGKYFFAIILIFGTILAFANSYIMGEYGREFSTEQLMDNLIQVVVYAFIEYCTYHIIALLVGALATIVQNSKITADIALYNTAHSSEEGLKSAKKNIKDRKNSDRLAVLDQWLREGSIDEKEYQQKKEEINNEIADDQE